MRFDDPALVEAVAATTGRRPTRLTPLSGGCIAEVYRVDLAGGGAVVVKASTDGGLDCEAWMLGYLACETDLPVPAVLHAGASSHGGLLVMDYVETAGGLDGAAERHAAELLAALHGISADRFGFQRDTLIGPLVQPNPWCARWLDFFVEHRLLYMGRIARESGHLPASTFARLERLCGKLERYIEPPSTPSLIHGDLWGGNVLARNGRIAAFVDPAIYFADAEIELAFATLFATFGEAFFARYRELRPIAFGFFEARRDLYNLYPLLVHSALFGGHYPGAVSATLARYG